MKTIYIDGTYPKETRVAICKGNNNDLVEIDFDTFSSKKPNKGNIYIGRITRVEPALHAAFVEYGDGKQGFVSFSEIHPCYYNLPEDVVKEENSAKYRGQYDNSKLIAMLSTRELVSPTMSPDDDELPVVVPETIVNYSTVIDKPAPEILEISQEIDKSPQELNDSIIIVKDEQIISLENNQDLSINSVASVVEDIIEAPSEQLPQDHMNESSYKRYSIGDVIRKNQIILVQVIKEERGNKGATLTTYISLAGRYCVLMPNSLRQGGISRRIPRQEDRKRIKDIIDSLALPEGVGVIIRTAGADRSKAEIKRDYDYLVKTWNAIRNKSMNAKGTDFLHAEGDVIKRCIRDIYDNTMGDIIIQGEQVYRQAKELMKMLMPHRIDRVKPFKGKVPIFEKFKINNQIGGMHDQVVVLPSGGYIVIGHTEALIAIDVNSGKLITESNVEETAIKTNIEAAVEIAKQIRLRDLSGIIVVDFIDMNEQAHKNQVESVLREAMLEDKAKIQLSRISPVGVLEIARQRLKPNYLESNTAICAHCNGLGRVKTNSVMGIEILRAIEVEIYKGDCEQLKLYANPEHITYILNNYRREIGVIESKYQTAIFFVNDYMMTDDQYSIEKIKKDFSIKRNQNVDGQQVYEPSEPNPNNKKKPSYNNWKKADPKTEPNIELRAEQPIQENLVNASLGDGSNIEVIESPIESTKEGAYRSGQNRRNKISAKRKKKKFGGHYIDNNRKKLDEEVSDNSQQRSQFSDNESNIPEKHIEKVYESAGVSHSDKETSILKELWKKIMD